MTDKETKKDNLEDLRTALVFARTRQALEEPYYEAISHDSFEKDRFIEATGYLREIQRILADIEYARSRMEKIPTTDDPSSQHGMSPEDHLLFYEGSILELVHQGKDKICQMVYAMVSTGEKKFKPLQGSTGKNKKSIITKLSEKPVIVAMPDMVAELSNWVSEEGKFKRIVNRRSSYHHGKNPLTARADYVDLQGLATILSSPFSAQLTDEGRKIIEEKREATLQRLYLNSTTQIDEVLIGLKEHSDRLAAILLKEIASLPTDPQEQKEIASKYQDFLDKIKHKNAASLQSIDEKHVAAIDKIRALANDEGDLAEHIKSIYLVGSLGRGEDVALLSDIQIVVVIDDVCDIDEMTNLIAAKLDDISTNPIRIEVYTEAVFSSDKSVFLWLVCHTDGILIYGTDLVPAKKIPTPGLFLAEVMAMQVEKNLIEIKSDVIDLPNKKFMLPYVGRQLAKSVLRTLYAVEVLNNPQYTNSLHKMIAIVRQGANAAKNAYMIDLCEKMLSGKALISLPTMQMFIDEFESGKLHSILQTVIDTAEEIRLEESRTKH